MINLKTGGWGYNVGLPRWVNGITRVLKSEKGMQESQHQSDAAQERLDQPFPTLKTEEGSIKLGMQAASRS